MSGNPYDDLRRARQPADDITLIRATDVTMIPVEWLWSNHLALGKLTVLSGQSELGKSTVSIDWIARMSRGDEWPDGNSAPRGSAIIISSEDGIEDTIKPRLVAVDANLERVHMLTCTTTGKGEHRTFSLQTDLEKLGEKLAAIGDVKLVVFDPITAYLGHKIDSHQTAPVRGALEPLQHAAERFHFAGLLIAHPQKAGALNVLNAVSGSGAFVHVPRLSFITITDPDDATRTLLLAGKNNLGRKAEGLAYRIESAFVGPDNKILTSRIVWDHLPVRITANEALQRAAEKERASARGEAEDFLRERVGNGGASAKELLEEADAHGINQKTLRRAAKKMGVKPRKNGFQGQWWWQKD